MSNKWNHVSKSRVIMPFEDFDASALDDIEVTRTEKSITIRVGDLVVLSRDTKVPYQNVTVTAWNWNVAEHVDLAVQFTKGQPSMKLDPYGNPPLGFTAAFIPELCGVRGGPLRPDSSQSLENSCAPELCATQIS